MRARARARRCRNAMRWLIGAAVSVALVACGGGGADPASSPDDTSATSAAGSADVPANLRVYVEGPVAEAVSAIVGDHGDLDGFAVTVVALDLGYSVQQILEHPRIAADGTVVGESPDGAPLGLLASGPQGLRSAVPNPARERFFLFVDLTLEDAYRASQHALAEQRLAEYRAARDAEIALAEAERVAAEAAAEEMRLAAVVLILMGQGYSLEEAMLGVVFGEYSPAGELGCVRLVADPSGPPTDSVGRACAENDTAAPRSTEPEDVAGGAADDDVSVPSDDADDAPAAIRRWLDGVYEAVVPDTAPAATDRTAGEDARARLEIAGGAASIELVWISWVDTEVPGASSCRETFEQRWTSTDANVDDGVRFDGFLVASIEIIAQDGAGCDTAWIADFRAANPSDGSVGTTLDSTMELEGRQDGSAVSEAWNGLAFVGAVEVG